MAVFWQTYLGLVNQRAVVKEKKLGDKEERLEMTT